MLTSTGTLQSPSACLPHSRVQTCQSRAQTPLPVIRPLLEPTILTHNNSSRHKAAHHSCCSAPVRSSASSISGSASVQQQQHASVVSTHVNPLSVWRSLEQQQPEHPESLHSYSASDVHNEQHQQLLPQHHVVLHGASHMPAVFTQRHVQAAEHQAKAVAAQTSSWQVLQLPNQDQLSIDIVTCRTAAQLLPLANSAIAIKGSRFHAAQLTVMAALLLGADARDSVHAAGAESSSRMGNGNSDQPAGAAAAHGDPNVEQQLATQIVQVLTEGSVQDGRPALSSLNSRYLAETLTALNVVVGCASFETTQLQQLMQQQVHSALARLQQQDMLSAIHACTHVQQLSAVMQWLQHHCSVLHVKAALVQLARLYGSSSSSKNSCTGSGRVPVQDLADKLLLLLRQQQQQLQQLPAHQAASILWSLGQLHQLDLKHYDQQLGQQLLYTALARVEQLNARVTAMMLHGASRLQLQLPEQQLPGQHMSIQQVPGQQLWPSQHEQCLTQRMLHHTQQQLSACDPQALAGMLWSLSQLQQQPGSAWMQQFYDSSWHMLSPSRDTGKAPATVYEQVAGRRASQACFKAQELASVLSALAHLQQQPPTAWLAAAVLGCYCQLQQFGQQELALVLWGLAKLQSRPPKAFLAAASRRVQEQLKQLQMTPQTVTLMLYAVTRLDLQPHDALMDQLWSHLRQCSSEDWPADLQHARDQLEQDSTSAEGLPAAAGNTEGSTGQLATDISVIAGQQLLQYNAQDLALLAWSLGKQCWQQRQQVVLPSAAWLQSYLTASAQQLQQGGFTSQGISILMWGLGALVLEMQQQGHSRFASNSSQVVPAFWAAVEAQSVQLLATFSAHELANMLWGAGCLVQGLRSEIVHTGAVQGSKPQSGHSCSSEWVDLLACQTMDHLDQITCYQLVAALQGLTRLQHPRGVTLLQAALSERCRARLVTARSQELLLVLRCCVYYKYTPDAAAWPRLVEVLQRNVTEFTGQQSAQALYQLGKMRQLHRKRQRQLLRQPAARPAPSHAVIARSSAEDAHNASCGMSGDSSRPHWHSQQQQIQQAHGVHVTQHDLLLPADLLCDLVQSFACQLCDCSPQQLSRGVWGLSQLVPASVAAQATSSSCSSSSNDSLDPHSIQNRASSSSSSSSSMLAAEAAVPFADCPAGQQLLQQVYQYSGERLHAFQHVELTTVLYAVHKLGGTRPPATWLDAIVQQTQGNLADLNAQGLAALVVALAGFNWVPTSSWLTAFVDAAVAAEQAGKFFTKWQRSCMLYGLSALDPVAAQAWLQRVSACSRTTAALRRHAVGSGSANSMASSHAQQQADTNAARL